MDACDLRRLKPELDSFLDRYVPLLDSALQRLRASYAEVGDISDELWCMDATIVRAARCSTGGGKRGTRQNQPIMR